MLTEERVFELHDGTWQASRAGEGNILAFARAVEREATEALRAENERLRGALDRAARTLRGETGCEDQGQAYDTAQRIIDAALAEKLC